ncbi:cell division protein FtsW (lipid II flippase) [Paenibacillus castaneae]|uniref:FtsW/RodA/SpoVE family cell cycle protein n=1 Tax=Paenibacillus castaneae TaxID=474957 RepID=UPI000C9B04B2|nr:FtsW/RodA/SpoVE family cell cycle protein [Paenibacillus castaneae]NIK78513.1 cell division protein FtsW (lipid II flippase) [Paenibacillus castaneae]
MSSILELENPEIKGFLNTVCQQVRAKKLHDEIKSELLCHIEEHVSDNLANGMSDEEAVKHAVSSMGDPKEIGRDLNKAHRPHTNWGLLFPLLLLSAAGLLTMASIQSSADQPGYILFFERKLLYTFVGLACMAIFWVIDYEKLKKYSEHFFILGLILLLLGSWFGLQVNGQRSWLTVGGGFSLYVPTISIFAMLLGLAGAAPARNWNWNSTLAQLAYRGLLPIIFLAKLNVFIWIGIYAVIFMVHIWITRKSTLQAISMAISIGVVGVCSLMLTSIPSSNYLRSRIMSFFYSKTDSSNSDYMLTKSLEAMGTNNWWGHGIGANLRIPYVHSEGVLPYFIYCFGWIAGLSVLILIFGFIYRLISSVIFIKDEYGKRVTTSICVLFVIQFIWSVSMVFGLVPFGNLELPFLSYGGTSQIIHFAMVGLLLGIYRRRDMVPIESTI